jgi:hypothetical protein
MEPINQWTHTHTGVNSVLNPLDLLDQSTRMCHMRIERLEQGIDVESCAAAGRFQKGNFPVHRPKPIKGPDNPTSQLLPIIRTSGCSGTEKEENTKEMVEGQQF